WIVPQIQAGSCPSTAQYASFWVGIDGYSSNTVEQIGTDSDCENGAPVYSAWFELYPHWPYTINSVPDKPGDLISAEVRYSGNTFPVSLTDLTTGGTFSRRTMRIDCRQSGLRRHLPGQAFCRWQTSNQFP